MAAVTKSTDGTGTAGRRVLTAIDRGADADGRVKTTYTGRGRYRVGHGQHGFNRATIRRIEDAGLAVWHASDNVIELTAAGRALLGD